MDGFLQELGKRLAERSFSLLILPGALYIAVAIAAHMLGQAHALDPHWLITQVTALAKSPVATTLGGQVVLLSAALALSAAVGLTAQALGSLVDRFALGSLVGRPIDQSTGAVGWRTLIPPLRQIAQRLVESRTNRWDAAHATYSRHYADALRGEDADPAERRTAYMRRTRIAMERPSLPSWSGDRMNSVAVRLRRDLHLVLPIIWPCLWLTLPESARTEIVTAREALTRATTLTAWAMLYAVLTVWWWPAAMLAVIIAVSSRHRIRSGGRMPGGPGDADRPGCSRPGGECGGVAGRLGPCPRRRGFRGAADGGRGAGWAARP